MLACLKWFLCCSRNGDTESAWGRDMSCSSRVGDSCCCTKGKDWDSSMRDELCCGFPKLASEEGGATATDRRQHPHGPSDSGASTAAGGACGPPKLFGPELERLGEEMRALRREVQGQVNALWLLHWVWGGG
jgi:hypothetical protein